MNRKARWTMYLICMTMVIGCVSYTSSKDSGAMASLGSKSCCKYTPTDSVSQEGYLLEDFPNIRAKITVVLEFDKENFDYGFIDRNKGKFQGHLLSFLSDKNVKDFKGAALLDHRRAELRCIFEHLVKETDKKIKLSNLYITNLEFLPQKIRIEQKKNN